MPIVSEAIGKRFSWDEIVGMFPDRWVGVSEYAKPLYEKGIKLFWDRTTYLPGNALWID